MTQQFEPTKRLGKVLIANRGEIALRIIRTLHETGRNAVAVYAESDIDAQHTQAADEAYSLNGTSAAQTYLDGDKVIAVAKRSQADGIHPGYGFLAENADFARSVIDAGLTWVGPSPEVLALLGDKIAARRVAVEQEVSPVPGSSKPLSAREDVEAKITELGFPVVVKAADGGGGRGIHVLRGDGDVDEFFASRDLTNGGAGFFIERYVPKARHVETQCGRDAFGNFTVYSTRDCSVQRRHQKLVEEAPAPFLSEETERAMFTASKAIFDAVDYIGLGTVEFLLAEDGSLYFLEVNPRLQVEHTVTEEVTGIDLVGQQIAIAEGKTLDDTPPVRGHAIELRITSEDPFSGLMPTTGTLTTLKWPTGPGLRIDSGVIEGDEVGAEFDSMVAKLIAWAPTRPQAIARALRAASQSVFEGVSTPLPLYRFVLDHPLFAGLSDDEDPSREPTRLGVWTKWLEDEGFEEFKTHAETEGITPSGRQEPAEDSPTAERTRVLIELDGKRAELVIPSTMLTPPASDKEALRPQPLRSAREGGRAAAKTEECSDVIASPIQAIVVRVLVEEGDEVAEGDTVMVLESMKMETYVYAPRAGVVKTVNVQMSENVAPGQMLVELESEQ